MTGSRLYRAHTSLGYLSKVPSDSTIRTLLVAVTGRLIGSDPLSRPEYQAYISSLRCLMREYDRQLLSLVSAGNDSIGDSSNAWSQCLSCLADFARSVDNFTIDEAVSQLVSRGHLKNFKDEVERDQARQAVFAFLGWMTGLYSALPPNDEWMPYLRIRSNEFGENKEVPLISRCERPFCELLDVMCGSFLPRENPEPTTQSTTPYNAKPRREDDYLSSDAYFVVDHMNARALYHIGGLRIIWVDDMPSHLALDIFHKTLMLYRYPSVCLAQLGDTSLLSRLLDSAHSNPDRPPGFTSRALLNEILLSYQLIFREDRKSRRLYRTQESEKASAGTKTDAILDMLCHTGSVDAGNDISWIRSPRTRSFAKKQHLPLLTPRLDEIQDYMLRQQPNHLLALWTDRRDRPRWYTFWAVVAVGGLSIALGFIQVILGIIQVVIGYKSLESS